LLFILRALHGVVPFYNHRHHHQLAGRFGVQKQLEAFLGTLGVV
jgi:hypothetical protein